MKRIYVSLSLSTWCTSVAEALWLSLWLSLRVFLLRPPCCLPVLWGVGTRVRHIHSLALRHIVGKTCHDAIHEVKKKSPNARMQCTAQCICRAGQDASEKAFQASLRYAGLSMFPWLFKKVHFHYFFGYHGTLPDTFWLF